MQQKTCYRNAISKVYVTMLAASCTPVELDGHTVAVLGRQVADLCVRFQLPQCFVYVTRNIFVTTALLCITLIRHKFVETLILSGFNRG